MAEITISRDRSTLRIKKPPLELMWIVRDVESGEDDGSELDAYLNSIREHPGWEKLDKWLQEIEDADSSFGAYCVYYTSGDISHIEFAVITASGGQE